MGLSTSPARASSVVTTSCFARHVAGKVFTILCLDSVRLSRSRQVLYPLQRYIFCLAIQLNYCNSRAIQNNYNLFFCLIHASFIPYIHYAFVLIGLIDSGHPELIFFITHKHGNNHSSYFFWKTDRRISELRNEMGKGRTLDRLNQPIILICHYSIDFLLHSYG